MSAEILIIRISGYAESEIMSRAEVGADFDDLRVAWVIEHFRDGALEVPRDRWWSTIEALIELSNLSGEWADYEAGKGNPEGAAAYRHASRGFSGAHTRLFEAGKALGWAP